MLKEIIESARKHFAFWSIIALLVGLLFVFVAFVGKLG